MCGLDASLVDQTGQIGGQVRERVVVQADGHDAGRRRRTVTADASDGKPMRADQHLRRSHAVSQMHTGRSARMAVDHWSVYRSVRRSVRCNGRLGCRPIVIVHVR